MVYRCRAQTNDGTLCKKRVSGPDTRCYLHQGKPAGRVAAPRKSPAKRTQRPLPQRHPVPRQPTSSRVASQPRQRSQPPTRVTLERRQADEAANLCVDVIERGSTAVIAERAAAYVSDETWATLVKRHRNRGCDDLARLARSILNGKDRLHDAVGMAAGSLLGLFGRSRIERVFAQELARRIPLSLDAQLSAAARGLQIAGIYICIVGNRDLVDCACLRDVIKVEGRERLQRLMQGALEDWRWLPQHVLVAFRGE